MLTVHATLQPNGQVQLPPALAKDSPVPVLVTILEPLLVSGDTGDVDNRSNPRLGGIDALRALLGSPAFLGLPMASAQEAEDRIQALRSEWNTA